MAEPNSKHRMCIETAVQQIMVAMEEDNEDIVGESGSSESDLSDKNDPTYVTPTIKTCYSETKVVMIGSTHLTDYESESEEEDKNPLDISPSTPNTLLLTSSRILWTRKDGTFWSSYSSPKGRRRTHYVICTTLHTVASSEIYIPKDAFQVFLSDNIIKKILLHTNLEGRRAAAQWNAVQKNSWLLLVFCSLQ